MKVFIGIIIGLSIAGLAFFGGYFYLKQSQKSILPKTMPSPEPTKGIIIGGDRDEHGCIGSAGYSWCEEKQKCLRIWEEPCSTEQTPTIDETALLKTVIKQALVAKHGSSAELLNITVSKIEADYASGGASAEAGGGMWFAAKVNGQWKLIWDGNGVISCDDISPYPNFPPTMIPECFDEPSGKSITR